VPCLGDPAGYNQPCLYLWDANKRRPLVASIGPCVDDFQLTLSIRLYLLDDNKRRALVASVTPCVDDPAGYN